MISDQLKDFLKDVMGVVEATSYERMCLWREHHQEKTHTWNANLSGYLPTIGQLDGRPVTISLLTAKIDGHTILFLEATSQVVDHQMIEHWLIEHLPDTAFCTRSSPGRHLNKVDSMNFHNVFPRG